MTRAIRAQCSTSVFETRDENGDLLFENKAVVVDRSAGNFGGDRGPKSEIVVPPERREPDFQVEYTTTKDQCALYRLSGDKNPLHIDPEFAGKGGFDRPILQGLCSFGFSGRAILHSVCGSDPARFKSFSVRFMNVVYPGDTLITEGWKTDTGALHHSNKDSGWQSRPGKCRGRSGLEDLSVKLLKAVIVSKGGASIEP